MVVQLLGQALQLHHLAIVIKEAINNSIHSNYCNCSSYFGSNSSYKHYCCSSFHNHRTKNYSNNQNRNIVVEVDKVSK